MRDALSASKGTILLNRLLGIYLVAAAVVAVNFMATPMDAEANATEFPVREVIDWFMAVAIIIALITGCARKCGQDGESDGPVTREYLAANVLFHVTATLALLFFSNGSSLLFNGDADGLV